MSSEAYPGQSWDKKFNLAGRGEAIPDSGIPEAWGSPRPLSVLLPLAQKHGWRVGPVTLVARFGHTDLDIPPWFASWEFLDGKWRFSGAKARNQQNIGFRDLKVVLENPTALLPEEPQEKQK